MENIFKKLFHYNEKKDYHFIINESSNNIPENEFTKTDKTTVYPDLSVNLEYLKSKYNILINSDIKIRDFVLPIKQKNFSAFIIYIDGMVNGNSINSFILEPILLKNSITMSPNSLDEEKQSLNKSVTVRKAKKFNLEDFIFNSLIPQNSISKEKEFSKIISKINAGFCILFVDTLETAFCIEAKGFKGRSVSEPITESVLRGAQEGFVEELRTNTSMLRKIINNENLIIEETSVGKISKTKVAICYLNDITNSDLVAEVKYRINNLDIDYLLSSGQLEQFIADNPKSVFPQLISTERPDRTCNYLFGGRVAILINGSPFSLIVPGMLIDFLTSPEDVNLNYIYTNFLRFIRIIALLVSLTLPGLYVAITNFHHELIPSELLFAMINARQAIPFPIIFEILLMEFSFELIQEASIRVSSSFSTTVGIIGALILGEAAVSANIVSPVLIIVVASTGICGFAITDNSLWHATRMFRFMYIILGYMAGFLGIALGFFIHFIILSNTSSFGISYFSPYIPFSHLEKSGDMYYMNPIWKRENRSRIFNTKKPSMENQTSMKWRNNGK